MSARIKRERRRASIILHGERTTDPVRVRLAYLHGPFHYQFHGKGHTSRIMNCDNAGELEWLAGQIARGSYVIIRPQS